MWLVATPIGWCILRVIVMKTRILRFSCSWSQIALLWVYFLNFNLKFSRKTIWEATHDLTPALCLQLIPFSKAQVISHLKPFLHQDILPFTLHLFNPDSIFRSQSKHYFLGEEFPDTLPQSASYCCVINDSKIQWLRKWFFIIVYVPVGQLSLLI